LKTTKIENKKVQIIFINALNWFKCVFCTKK